MISDEIVHARASRRRHIIFQSICITRVFALVFFFFFVMQVWNYMQKTCAAFMYGARAGFSKCLKLYEKWT